MVVASAGRSRWWPVFRCPGCETRFSAPLRPRSTLLCVCGGIFDVAPDPSDVPCMPATPVRERAPARDPVGYDANGSPVCDT